MMKLETILERFPYRYVSVGKLDNGFPDYRIQKYNDYTKRYKESKKNAKTWRSE